MDTRLDRKRRENSTANAAQKFPQRSTRPTAMLNARPADRCSLGTDGGNSSSLNAGHDASGRRQRTTPQKTKITKTTQTKIEDHTPAEWRMIIGKPETKPGHTAEFRQANHGVCIRIIDAFGNIVARVEGDGNDHEPKCLANMICEAPKVFAERDLLHAQNAALLAACEFGVKLCVAMAKDADPHIGLKRGESADFDATCDALDIFRAAIAAARGEK